MKKLLPLRAILTLSIFLLYSAQAFAVEITFTPRLTLGGEYNDNIFRTPDDEQDDYIYTVSPGVTLGFQGATAGLTLSYNPSYVQYQEDSYDDQWRHFGSALGKWRMSRSTTLAFNHSVTISEDAADDQGDTTVNALTGRTNRFTRNAGNASFTYQFGITDSLSLGYKYSLLEYEERTEDVENSRRSTPYMDFSWWFTQQLGFNFYTDYTYGQFDRSDNFDSYSGNLRFLLKLTPRLDMFVQYGYMQTVYDGETEEDYTVNNPGLGFDYIAGETTNVSLAFGYMVRDREFSEDDEGLVVTGNVNTVLPFSRGQFNITASSGYSQDTFASENLGFSIYYGANLGLNYNFTRVFGSNVFVAYKYSDYLDQEPEIEDYLYSAGAGLSYIAFRWLRFGLNYTHRSLISSSDPRDYTENRVSLTATIEPSIPFKLN